MIQTFNGCTRTEIWASPTNWNTTTAKSSLKKQWYVQCYFFDPVFKEKYPNGFPYRIRTNRSKTLPERRAEVLMAIETMANLLDVEAFNPIPNSEIRFMKPKEATEELPVYNKTTPVNTALDLAFTLCEQDSHTIKDIKSVLKYFQVSVRELDMEQLAVNDFLHLHAVRALKNVRTKKSKYAAEAPLSDKRYNKYKAYLSGLFNLLKKNKMIELNPFEEVSDKKVIVQKRTILTIEERRRIDVFLRANFPSFWIFIHLFFHSGGRLNELLSLKTEDVDLNRLIYTTLIRKGGQYELIERPIKVISVSFWEKALRWAKKGEYVFSVGLEPGSQQIRRDQVTRRWRVHVKEKLGIDVDLYALKHGNLTEIAEKVSLKAAARAAGHKNDRMVREHYYVNIKEKEMENVRKMTNSFAPPKPLGNKVNCNPSIFAFDIKKRPKPETQSRNTINGLYRAIVTKAS